MKINNYFTYLLLKQLIVTLLTVSCVCLINLFLLPFIGYKAVGMVILLSIHIGALLLKDFLPVLSAFLCFFLWNFLYIPHRYTFKIASYDDWLMLSLFLITAFFIGFYTKKIKINQNNLKNAKEKIELFYKIALVISSSSNIKEMVTFLEKVFNETINLSFSIFIKKDDSLESYGNFKLPQNEHTFIKRIIDENNSNDNPTITKNNIGRYIPLVSGNTCYGVLAIDNKLLTTKKEDFEQYIETIANQISVHLNKDYLLNELKRKELFYESEKIYKTILSTVSHELKTPISTIKGFVGALGNYSIKKEPAKYNEVIAEIKEGISRLELVVQNFLDMNRIESGKLILNEELTDINEIIFSNYYNIKNILGNREFVFDVDDNIPLIMLDNFLISRAILNVYINECIHTPNKTKVYIRAYVNDKLLIINIKDTGTGLGTLPNNVFNKFYRGNPQTSGGIGLGLSITSAIIKLHSGTIEAKNDNGAFFSIKIPILRDDHGKQNISY